MRATALACAAVLLLAACADERDAMTMTQDDARARVERMVGDVRTAMGAELKAGPLGPVPCDDPSDGGPPGRVFVENSYEILQAQRVNPIAAARTFFQQHGYRLRRDETGYISAENPADGFRIVVETNDAGHAHLTVSSPCVWPSGTPQP